MSQIKIVAGLGNPGPEYTHTYHNVGMLAADFLVEEEGIPFKTHASKLFLYAKTKLGTIVKPLTFMNDSGIALSKALHFLKHPPETLLVIHDDSDIMLGNVKYAFGRGAAGHRGVASIIEHLGTKEFLRMRIGIRKTSGRAEKFVLKKISNEDQRIFYSVFFGFTEKLKEKDSFCSYVR